MARTVKVNTEHTSKHLFCGLDLSLTGTGIVVIDRAGAVIFKKVLKNKLKGMERLKFIRNEIADVYKKHEIQFTCVEGYSMGSHAGRAFDIGELGGVIKLALWSKGIPYHLVPPTQVKRYVTGKGNCQKNMIIMAVYKEWGHEAKDDNEADSLALSHIARAIKLTVPLRKHQSEIIIQIRADLKERET